MLPVELNSIQLGKKPSYINEYLNIKDLIIYVSKTTQKYQIRFL